LAKGPYRGGGKPAAPTRTKAPSTGRPSSKPSQITRDELKHFAFRDRSKEAFLDELDPLLRACFKGGFTRPNEVAGLLNKAGKSTACGQPWTPHLVWSLQRFSKGARRRERLKPRPPQRWCRNPSSPASARKIWLLKI